MRLPPNPLRSATAALRYIRTMIRDNTNGRIRGLYLNCRNSGGRLYVKNCSLEWRIGRFAFRGNGRFFHFIESNTVYWDFSFKGSKKRIGCRRCSRKTIRWT